MSNLAVQKVICLSFFIIITLSSFPISLLSLLPPIVLEFFSSAMVFFLFFCSISSSSHTQGDEMQS
jgi:hypothetical protein